MDVQFDAEGQRWTLSWKDAGLRFRLKEGLLLNTYFGPSQQEGATREDVYTDDFPFRDNLWRTRTEAAVALAPDDRPVGWSLQDWSQPTSDVVLLVLQANQVPLQCELRFVVDEETGLLRRQTLLRHTGAGPAVELSQVGSVSVLLPANVEQVVHLSGLWGAETQVQRMPLAHTAIRLESRSGKTGFEHAPYVALEAADATYLCELLWSGNWQLQVRRLADGRVNLYGGLNDWGFRHRLHPGDELALPDALLACVPGDLNAGTQRLHDYLRRHKPNPDRPIPVQFNSWYPYPGEPPVARMKEFAATAAELGCEVFVLDAGWYTTESEEPNENWWTRTGDWVVNRRLFPNGLEELSDYCRARGLAFGIWFEPEAVSPNAVVRREHPEWLHHVGGEPTPPDQRGILNLGVPAARAFALERILRILRATGATWMKWDFNTDLRQGGWAPGLPEALTHEDPLVAHYRGVYQLQDEIRAAVPELTLEMCAGGGGRFDAAIQSHAHTNWMSDQTQPLKNLAIHFGSHLAHPAMECNDWLIEWPPHDGLHGRQPHVDQRGDLAFRTRIAMLGTFGISAPVERWSAADLEIVRTHIIWYKQYVRPLIHHGDQYLLTEPPPLDGQGDWAAIWYAAKDAGQGVLFAFRLASAEAERAFALPGLDPGANYRVRTPEGEMMYRSGAQLVDGFPVHTAEPFRSALVHVERL
ncbi:MAG: alpha-galactosidase [Pirellulaceae bacterium]|nr:MAG: alpha-galactosidase [Pirellulaceae bacterium]